MIFPPNTDITVFLYILINISTFISRHLIIHVKKKYQIHCMSSIFQNHMITNTSIGDWYLLEEKI